MDSCRPTTRWMLAQIKDDKKRGISDNEILKRVNSNGYIFNHTMFDKLRKAQQEQDDYISHPPEVEEGVVECHRCGSRRVFSVSIQTRAPDEPMSTKAHCIECKNKWVQNS